MGITSNRYPARHLAFSVHTRTSELYMQHVEWILRAIALCSVHSEVFDAARAFITVFSNWLKAGSLDLERCCASAEPRNQRLSRLNMQW